MAVRLIYHTLVLLTLTLFAVVVAWNVTDIINVGANFWNVFWLAMVATWTLGGTVVVQILDDEA
jgi:hypothetical protein